jgi:hypothetical protein
MDMNKHLGKIQYGINVAEEYENLANEDEMAARSLKNLGQFRHSIYFFVQAMEKHIRSRIFSLVNPNNEYFMKRNKNHSINDAITFLIEIISNNELVKIHIKSQIEKIFAGINFQFLHNNLRYPFYSERHDDYSIIHFSLEDCLFIENTNEVLRKYLMGLGRL